MEGRWRDTFNNSSPKLLELFRVHNQQRCGLVTGINDAWQHDTIILFLPMRRFYKYGLWRKTARLLPRNKFLGLYIQLDKSVKRPLAGFYTIRKPGGVNAGGSLNQRHFRVASNLIMKATLSQSFSYDLVFCILIKTSFYNKSFAIRLAFILRFKAHYSRGRSLKSGTALSH